MTESDSDRGNRVDFGVSADQFTVPASDARGHSERKTFRCTPSLIQQVGNIIQSRVFPYRQDSELIRHALVRHLQWLESISSQPIRSVRAQVQALMDICQHEESMSDFQTTTQRLMTVINTYMARGDTAQARRLLLRVRAHIRSMPDADTYWRDRYMEQLEHDYGDLLKDIPKASLHPLNTTREED